MRRKQEHGPLHLSHGGMRDAESGDEGVLTLFEGAWRRAPGNNS